MASQSNGLFIATFKVVSIQWCQNYHLKVMMVQVLLSYLDFSWQMKFIKLISCYATRLINQNEHPLCSYIYVYLDLDNKLIRLFGRVTLCKLKQKIKLLYTLASTALFLTIPNNASFQSVESLT